MTPSKFAPVSRVDIASWIIAGGLLLLLLPLHLLPALVAGLTVYELVHITSARLPHLRAQEGRAKMVAVAILAAVIVALLTAGLFGLFAFLHSDTGHLTRLLQKMAEIIESSRDQLPDWLASKLPADAESLRVEVTHWLREHAVEVQTVGKETVLGLVHILIGLILGAMVALHDTCPDRARAPLARALSERAGRLAEAFRRIVFAQVRIAAVNAAFTAVYLLVALPLAGVHLPFAKTLVLVTFLVGLLPVVGNLISNSVIVVVSLANSLGTAVASLVFLVVIHKLEYFLNARIVGSQIHARAWELLLAMLLMEAAFGMPGVVAAPIYYAYLKDELTQRGLI